LIFAVIGDGKVANGTWKALNNLPIQKIDPT
jgi:deoxyxylulose-5-phosphate synthase